jgi:hypothetical protein
MITLVVLALTVTALVFAAVPVLGYALMLETCEGRAARAPRMSASPSREPRMVPMGACFAAE